MHRRLYLVAYDISSARRLQAALKCVRNWSTGGQLSVHECWLSDGELRELRRRLLAIIDRNSDSLLILRLDPRQKPHALGRAVPPDDPDWFLIG